MSWGVAKVIQKKNGGFPKGYPGIPVDRKIIQSRRWLSIKTWLVFGDPPFWETPTYSIYIWHGTPRKKFKATKGQYSIWMISPFIASESIHHLSLACETVPPHSNQTTVEIHTFKVQQIINSRHLLLAHPQFLTRINITRGWHFRIYCEILILLYIFPFIVFYCWVNSLLNQTGVIKFPPLKWNRSSGWWFQPLWKC